MTTSFLRCSECGKKLIARQGNGIFHFRFGRIALEEGEKGEFESPVDMKIFGSVKMKCIRKTCRHENTFNYFPTQS